MENKKEKNLEEYVDKVIVDNSKEERQKPIKSSSFELLITIMIFVFGVLAGILIDRNFLVYQAQNAIMATVPDAPAAVNLDAIEPTFDNGNLDAKHDFKIIIDNLCPYSQQYMEEIVLPSLIDNKNARVRIYDMPMEDLHEGTAYISQLMKVINEDGRYIEMWKAAVWGHTTFDQVIKAMSMSSRYEADYAVWQEEAITDENIMSMIGQVQAFDTMFGGQLATPITIIDDSKIYTGVPETYIIDSVLNN